MEKLLQSTRDVGGYLGKFALYNAMPHGFKARKLKKIRKEHLF